MTDAHGVARDQLRAFIERIERLEEEKKTIADDIKDVFGEAKAMGFDTKIMKQVIALRKKDDQERTEEEIIRDTYLAALGMIPDFEHEARSELTEKRSARSAAPLQMRPETVSELPETANEMQHPGSHPNGNPEPALGAANRPIGEDGMVSMARTEAAAVTDRRDDHPNSPETAAGETGMVLGTGRERPLSIGLHTDGDPEARFETDSLHHNSPADQPHTGGSHVDAHEDAATHQAGVVSNPPANPLRPNCLKPSDCGGYGRTHCYPCTQGNREVETA